MSISVIPKLSPSKREQFIQFIDATRKIGQELDETVAETMEVLLDENKLQRRELMSLDDSCIKEILIGWWRQNGFYSYERQTLERALKNIAAPKSGQIVPLKGDLQMTVGRTELALNKRER